MINPKSENNILRFKILPNTYLKGVRSYTLYIVETFCNFALLYIVSKSLAWIFFLLLFLLVVHEKEKKGFMGL